MLDLDTFLVELYVSVDEFCKPVVHPARPGRSAALYPSEVVTLSVLGQWSHFASELAFYRFAQRRLRAFFPRLPDHSQFVRQQRRHEAVLAGFFQHLARQLQAPQSPFEIVDRVGVATRHIGRRGFEWLAGYSAIGYSNRLGYFHGLQVLTAVTADGVLTGFGVGAGNTKDQPMAESFFALRHTPQPRFPSVGTAAGNQTYVADKGFSGPKLHRKWRQAYGAQLICAPQRRHGLVTFRRGTGRNRSRGGGTRPGCRVPTAGWCSPRACAAGSSRGTRPRPAAARSPARRPGRSGSVSSGFVSNCARRLMLVADLNRQFGPAGRLKPRQQKHEVGLRRLHSGGSRILSAPPEPAQAGFVPSLQRFQSPGARHASPFDTPPPTR